MTDHLTTAGAGAAITMPLWLQEINPLVQFVVAVLGGVWIGVQIFYKIRNETRDRRSKS